MLHAAFRFLQRYATQWLAAGIFVGLAFQDLAALLHPFVIAGATLSMFLAMLRLDWGGVGRYLRRPWLPAATLVAAMLVLPVAMDALVGLWLGPDDPLRTGLVLGAGGPPLTSAVAYALFLGLDSALCLTVSLPAMMLAPLVMPPVLLGLLGVQVELSMVDLALRLAVMIGAALGGAAIARPLMGAERVRRNATWIDGGIVGLNFCLSVGVMQGVQQVVLAEPAKAALYVGLAFAANVGMQVLALVLLLRLDRRRALTVGLLLGNRNGFLLLAAVGTSATPDVVLFLVAIQFPLAVMPMLLRPIMVRVLPAEAFALSGIALNRRPGRKD